MEHAKSDMTEKVFWKDPYLARLETAVTSVDGNIVTLKKTIFFALSGGQESDAGSIGGTPVLEARKEDKEIHYTLAPNHGLAVGDRVVIDIDWDRRYRLMRLHFAAELILELMYKLLQGAAKIGAHISADKARIDFEWPQNISVLLPGVQKQAQQIIDADLPILSAFSDESLEQRYWEVEGLSRVACGGTHLLRTGEVGPIRLKRKNIGKGKERVEIAFA